MRTRKLRVPSNKRSEPLWSADAKPRKGKGQLVTQAGRTPLTIKFRSDIATALKRASLERELSRVRPFTQQDILEAALVPWLRSNGYLT
jgi:hypothetical protein